MLFLPLYKDLERAFVIHRLDDAAAARHFLACRLDTARPTKAVSHSIVLKVGRAMRASAELAWRARNSAPLVRRGAAGDAHGERHERLARQDAQLSESRVERAVCLECAGYEVEGNQEHIEQRCLYPSTAGQRLNAR